MSELIVLKKSKKVAKVKKSGINKKVILAELKLLAKSFKKLETLLRKTL